MPNLAMEAEYGQLLTRPLQTQYFRKWRFDDIELHVLLVLYCLKVTTWHNGTVLYWNPSAYWNYVCNPSCFWGSWGSFIWCFGSGKNTGHGHRHRHIFTHCGRAVRANAGPPIISSNGCQNGYFDVSPTPVRWRGIKRSWTQSLLLYIDKECFLQINEAMWQFKENYFYIFAEINKKEYIEMKLFSTLPKIAILLKSV